MLKQSTQLSVLYFAFVTVLVSGIKQKCPRFHIKRVRENTIVKPHESRANGAEFHGVVLASSYHECYDECCKKKNCDMVNVKVDYSAVEKRFKCFLFACKSPTKCRFHSVEEPDAKTKYSVLEFESRDDDSPFSSITARKNHQKEETENVARPAVEKHKKQEHEWRKQWSDHEDKNENQYWYDALTTVSPHIDNTDHRKSNSHHKKGEESGTWSNTRETTTEYHKETEPPTTEPPTKNKDLETEYGSYVGSKYSFDRNHDAIGDEESKVEEPTDPTDLDEDFPRRVFVDNNPDYPELPKSHRKIPRSTNPPVTEKKMTKPTKKNQNHKETSKKATTKTAPTKTTSSGYNNVVIKRFSIQENKAVIPLAVGLVLSLLLLMAVVFRLKTSRRRRTKAFLTDDADYLINGMYL